MLWIVLSRVMPALLTTMSTVPNSAAAAAIMASASARFTVFSVDTRARPPAPRTASAVSFAGSGSTSFTTTAAPSSANRTAVARPMPRPEPVITATLPSRRPKVPPSREAQVRGRRPGCRPGGRQARPGRTVSEGEQGWQTAPSGSPRSRTSNPPFGCWKPLRADATIPHVSSPKRGPAIKVLVVDDQQSFAQALSLALGLEHDLEARAVTSGEEAGRAIGDDRPDVVILDAGIAGNDGAEVTRELKRSDPTVDVIVLADFEDDLTKARALEAGASGVLSKS